MRLGDPGASEPQNLSWELSCAENNREARGPSLRTCLFVVARIGPAGPVTEYRDALRGCVDTRIRTRVDCSNSIPPTSHVSVLIQSVAKTSRNHHVVFGRNTTQTCPYRHLTRPLARFCQCSKSRNREVDPRFRNREIEKSFRVTWDVDLVTT